MSELKNNSTDLNETKTITIKRQYTDQHPAMTAGLHARIRNKVLEAIADGNITNEKLMKIIGEESTNSKKWFSNNKKYFTVSETGSVSLSKFGMKILNTIKVNEEKPIKKTTNIHMETKFLYESFDSFIKATAINEASQFLFSFDYNTDEGDVAYIQRLLKKAGVDAVAQPGLDSEEMEVKAKNAVELRKAKKAIEADGFEINEAILNEAFKSLRLSNLFATAGNQAGELSKAFYRTSKLQLDQIEDYDLIEITPDAAYKAKGGNKFIFYISDVEKENPYAPEDTYRTNKMVPGSGHLLAVTDADNNFYGTTWVRGEAGENRNAKALKKIEGKPGNDSIGIGKVYRGYDATGLYNAKRISEVADRAIVLDIELLRQRYSTVSIKDERAAARKGATAFTNDKDFKTANLARYNAILTQKAMELPLDTLVLNAIDKLSADIKEGIAKGTTSQYGEILIGLDKKGREIKLSDAANIMRNVLDDYSRYVSALSTSIEQEKRYGIVDDYYKRDAANHAKSLQDRVKKIENMDYAW